MRRFRICFHSRFADSLVAAVSRQRRGGRRRRQAVDFAAYVGGFAGAAGSTISPVGFSGTTEMSETIYRYDVSRARDTRNIQRLNLISTGNFIRLLICKINDECEKWRYRRSLFALFANDYLFLTKKSYTYTQSWFRNTVTCRFRCWCYCIRIVYLRGFVVPDIILLCYAH